MKTTIVVFGDCTSRQCTWLFLIIQSGNFSHLYNMFFKLLLSKFQNNFKFLHIPHKSKSYGIIRELGKE